MYTMKYRLGLLQSSFNLDAQRQSKIDLLTKSAFIPSHNSSTNINDQFILNLTLSRPTQNEKPKNRFKALACKKKSFERNGSFTLLKHRSLSPYYTSSSLSLSRSHLSMHCHSSIQIVIQMNFSERI